jgi:putative oxidoreductase
MAIQAGGASLEVDRAAPGVGMTDFMMLIARVLMAQVFIVSGIRKALAWNFYVKYMGATLPMPEVLIYAVVLLEIGGGVLFVLGWRTRQLAFLLAGFTVLAGLFFHQFWAAEGAQFAAQLNHFMKNIAIVGGLLLFMVHGGGRLSVSRN